MRVLAETFGIWSGTVTTYVNGEKQKSFTSDGTANFSFGQDVEKNDTFKISLEGVETKGLEIEVSLITDEPAEKRAMTEEELKRLCEVIYPPLQFVEPKDTSLIGRIKRFLKLTDWFEIMLRIMLIVIIIMFLCSASIFFYELYCGVTF